MQIVTLSIERAGKATTPNVLKNCLVAIPESQSKEYAKTIDPKRLLLIPDELTTPYDSLIEKPISKHKARNWIREQVDEDWLVMIDDNLSCLRRTYVGKDGQETKITSGEEIEDILKFSCYASNMSDCKMFGFAESYKTSDYDPFKPISLTGYIPSTCFGIHKSNRIIFQKDWLEGHWITGMNAHHHKICWIDKRFNFKMKQTVHPTITSEQWTELELAFGKNAITRTKAGELNKMNI